MRKPVLVWPATRRTPGRFGAHRHVLGGGRLAATYALLCQLRKTKQAYQRWLAHAQAQLERKLLKERVSQRLPELASPELQQAFCKRFGMRAVAPGWSQRWCMGLMEVESGFRKFACQQCRGARRDAGDAFLDPSVGHTATASALFQWQANLRFGCVILRHYLTLEQGDLQLALGRYNGRRGQLAYPQAVLGAQRRWQPCTRYGGFKRLKAWAIRRSRTSRS
jgi:hypothetical protein